MKPLCAPRIDPCQRPLGRGRNPLSPSLAFLRNRPFPNSHSVPLSPSTLSFSPPFSSLLPYPLLPPLYPPSPPHPSITTKQHRCSQGCKWECPGVLRGKGRIPVADYSLATTIKNIFPPLYEHRKSNPLSPVEGAAAHPMTRGPKPSQLVHDAVHERDSPGSPPKLPCEEDGTTKRGVYSFCMCPGGQIVPTSTNPEELCINGMSFRCEIESVLCLPRQSRRFGVIFLNFPLFLSPPFYRSPLVLDVWRQCPLPLQLYFGFLKLINCFFFTCPAHCHLAQRGNL